jgi:hypothetical protein
MEKKRVQLAGVSATIVASLFLLGYYSVYFAWEELRPYDHYYVRFTRTLGLQKKDDVLVYGYRVGRVKSLRFEKDHQLADIEVEPDVRLFKKRLDGFRWIEQPLVLVETDTFGSALVRIEPGEPSSGTWPPNDPTEVIDGSFHESILTGGESVSTSALHETLKDVESFTGELTKSDSGLIGRMLNEPDAAVTVKDLIRGLHGTVKGFHELTADIEAGNGVGALVTTDARIPVDDAVRGARDTFDRVHEETRQAAQGASGFAGRLLADPDAATSVRTALADTRELFSGYQHGEETTAGLGYFFARPDDPSNRFLAWLQGLEEDTGRARTGDGAAGPFFGPRSGQDMEESLNGLVSRLEAMSAGDPSAGSFFSPSPEGRRTMEDFVTRIDATLRDMRRALGKIRADQGPNTFPGALLSVF